MKTYLSVMSATLVALCACSPMRNMSGTLEDDIYYIPGEKALMVKEVETFTGNPLPSHATPQGSYIPQERQIYDEYAPAFDRRQGAAENIPTRVLTEEVMLHENDEMNHTWYENRGHWIGNFNGTTQDLREAMRIIQLYPEGFGFASNGLDIAMDLSFNPDWNVYTDEGRFWWFPSPSNMELYNTFVFGTYPKYRWTVVWNTPAYDSWAFNTHFNWGVRWNVYGGGWNIGLGWHYYDPWYNPWYYDAWYGYPRYGSWYHSHYYSHNWYHHNYHHSGYRPSVYSVRRQNGRLPSRPGTSVRSGTYTRQGTITRPGGITRPGSITRPGATTRPGTSTRPGTVVRPGATTRPGTTITRPGTTTRQGATTRPNTSAGPNTGTSRPGATSGARYTRPAAGSSTNYAAPKTTNIKNYDYRTGNSQRPTYNTRSSSTRSGSSYTPSSNRSSVRSSGSATRSSGGGGSRSSGGSSNSRRR